MTDPARAAAAQLVEEWEAEFTYKLNISDAGITLLIENIAVALRAAEQRGREQAQQQR